MADTSTSLETQCALTHAEMDKKPTRALSALGLSNEQIQIINDRCKDCLEEIAAINPDSITSWKAPNPSMKIKKICEENARSIADESLINRVMDSLQKNQPLGNKFPPIMLASITARLMSFVANQSLIQYAPSSQAWFKQHLDLFLQEAAGLEGGLEEAMNSILSEENQAINDSRDLLQHDTNINVDNKTQSNVIEAGEIMALEQDQLRESAEAAAEESSYDHQQNNDADSRQEAIDITKAYLDPIKREETKGFKKNEGFKETIKRIFEKHGHDNAREHLLENRPNLTNLKHELKEEQN